MSDPMAPRQDEDMSETEQAMCSCGKPAEHVNADPDGAEWACRVPDFDPMTGQLRPRPLIDRDALAKALHPLDCSRCRMGWSCGGVLVEDEERAGALLDALPTAGSPMTHLTTREQLAEALENGGYLAYSGDAEAAADALLASSALTTPAAYLAGLAEDEAAVERVADALRRSRLPWGTHADRWTDREWQDGFWREAAQIALVAALSPAQSERAEVAER